MTARVSQKYRLEDQVGVMGVREGSVRGGRERLSIDSTCSSSFSQLVRTPYLIKLSFDLGAV